MLSRSLVHINNPRRALNAYAKDAPNQVFALAYPDLPWEGRPMVRRSKYQQLAMFHHTPIDWVIWNEFRISFSLIAWMRGAS